MVNPTLNSQDITIQPFGCNNRVVLLLCTFYIVSIVLTMQVVDLGTQLIYFKNVEKKLREKLGDAETKKLLSKAIYLFNVGINDYVVRVTNSTILQSSTSEEYVGTVIGNLTAAIKVIRWNNLNISYIMPLFF